MVHLHYHLLTQWLHTHPHWGAVAAFVIAFSESLAVIGSIIPGSVTMTAIGILAGSGVLPIWTIIFCAIIGAIVGDGLSYLLGYYLKDNIQKYWPFSRYPQALTKGQSFFVKHGGKSILIGRFVGAIRAIIPIIAGMLKMPPKRYFPFSIISAILWAPLYMLPGILIGAISLEMPTHIATEVILFILALLIGIWLLIWGIHYVYRLTHGYFKRHLDNIWERWQEEQSHQFLTFLLRNRSEPNQRGQLLLAAFALVLALLFIILFINVILHGPLLDANHFVFHLFRGLRTPTLDKIMVFLTSLGNKTVILPLIITLFIYFSLHRRWLTAFHWLAGGIFAAGAVFVFKHIYFSHRPWGILHNPANSSFPSGHTTLSIALYGLCAFFLTRNLPKPIRKTIYWITFLICAGVVLSRVYLGAHWLTDVTGGTLCASTILCIIVISYRRFKSIQLFPVRILLVVLLTLFVTDSWYLYNHYQKLLHNSQPYWPTHTISEQAWWEQASPLIPTYRVNRFGSPVQVFNIQWAGNINDIKATLKQHGWTNILTRDYLTTLKILIREHLISHQMLFARLFKDQHPVLELVKHQPNRSPALIMRLWPSNIFLAPRDFPLWVGTVYYNTTQSHHLFFFHKSAPTKTDTQTSNALMRTLVKYTWEIKIVQPHNIPRSLLDTQHINWVALIRPRRTYD